MRPVLVVVLLAVVPAYADTPPAHPAPKTAPQPAPKAAPQPKGQPRVLPPATLQDVMPRTPPSSDGGAGDRTGMVIEPPPHPDARPWPEGIAMTPPDIKDPMAMGVRAPASEPLRAAALWGKRLADSLEERLGKIVELALPRSL